MFITIQHVTFNLDRISHISISELNKKVIQVRTCEDRDCYFNFQYKDEKEALRVFDEINHSIKMQQSLYGRR